MNSERLSLLKEFSKSKYENFTYDNVYSKRTRLLDITAKLRETVRPVKVRKNIKELTPEAEETILLKSAIDKAISSGEYSRFVTYHSQYMWDIHTMRPQINQRFLPWHRVYLLKFEEMLNRVMGKDDTNDKYNIALPYWDWEVDHEIPEFLISMTPTMEIELYLWDDFANSLGTQIVSLTVKRFPGTHPDPRVRELPNEDQVNRIRKFRRFDRFTIELESGNQQIVGPHAIVHVWVGGINPNPDPMIPLELDSTGAMADITISPLDFCFWCHHANIDRIWASWQLKLEQEGDVSSIYPNLNEDDSKMHPWPEYLEPQTRNIQELGYTYDHL